MDLPSGAMHEGSSWKHWLRYLIVLFTFLGWLIKLGFS